MSLPKFNKLYFPGLISLVFLPLMCFWYFMSNDTFHKYQAMKIAWAPREIINKWISVPGKKVNIDCFRKYHLLTITGNIIHDEKELSKLKILLNQLYLRNDTVNGIKVSLGLHAQFGEFVSVLDICLQKDMGLSLDPIGYEIFIAHVIPRRTSSNTPTVDDVRFNLYDDVYSYPKPVLNSIEVLQSYMQYMYRILIEFWPSEFVFILMMLFTVFKTKRYLNLKNLHLTSL